MINDIICTSTCSEELKRDAKMWLMKPNLTFPFANTGSSNTIEIKNAKSIKKVDVYCGR